jgi:flagellin
MSLTINTNANSLNAQRNLAATQSSLATSMQRLSSGLRVNSAKDDAAGLAIADRMNAQVRGMNVAIRNTNDGISLLQTADGAASKITDMLQRMRELAVQASNGSNSDDDVTNLGAEYTSLKAEITRVVDTTKFNGENLLDATGGTAGVFKFQVGSGSTADDQVSVTLSSLATSSSTLGSLTDSAAAFAEIAKIDTSLDLVTTERANYGASQNQLESIVSTLQIGVENLSAARGRIIDADFAQETANLSRAQILQQAGTAMVAQANQLPQGVLALLRG